LADPGAQAVPGGGVGCGVAVGVGVAPGLEPDEPPVPDCPPDTGGVPWLLVLGEGVAVAGAGDALGATLFGAVPPLLVCGLDPCEMAGGGAAEAGWPCPMRPEPPKLPIASMPAVAVVAAPDDTTAPTRPKPAKSRLIAGICPIQAPNPIVRHRRPTEMLRKARTIEGSSCVPATRMSSCRDADTLIGRLYGRGAVITSYVSATDTMRAARQISLPFNPFG
jgi:hypothetical protein